MTVFAKFAQQKALVVMVVVAGLGWGAAVAALSAVKLPPPVPAATPGSADVAAELRDRTRELTGVQAQYRDAQLQLQKLRASMAPASVASAATVSPAPAATADVAALAAATATVAQLRGRLAELQSENAGLEQNYSDVLDALHRAQAEILTDRQRIAADEAREKK
jgi:predicted  nucleic acid-binding Zn-ribbon protein